MRFYIGLHHPHRAGLFDRAMVSINALRRRKSPFPAREWMMDSGAFTELQQYGRYREEPEVYAAHIRHWWGNGLLIAAATQDYMCEPIVIRGGTIPGPFGKPIRFAGTGLNVAEHQRLTIRRYDRIKAAVGPMVYILPVLQGYDPAEYVDHIGQYGDRLKPGAWVGIGSVCKRNADIEEIENVLVTVKRARPDLRLHGFGVKTTALESSIVRDCLWSADSMAWSFAARREFRDGNSPHEARRFLEKIESQAPRKRQFQERLF